MSEPAAAATEDHEGEIAALVRTLDETQRRLQELAGGEVDAVVYPGGHSYMLLEAQEKLRQSEERFTDAFEHAPIGVALVSPEGQWLKVNRALCEIVGYSGSALLTRTFQSITHPEDLDADLEKMREVLAGRAVAYELEKRYVHARGHFVTILLNVSLVRDGQGEPSYFIAQIQDITERKRAEEALRRSEDEFRTLAETVPQVVWVTRPDGMNIYFNQRWMDYTGLTLEESLGDGWNKPFHPDDRQRAWDAWQQATATAGNYSLECRLRRADGEYCWWLIRGEPLLDCAGHVLKWFGACTNVDELKQAQLRIADQAALIDEARDAIVLRDLENHITFWNKGAERLYGWTAAEACGKLLPSLLRMDRADFKDADRAVRTGGVWNGEIEKTAKDKRALTLDCRWTMVCDAQGQPRSILSIDTDITERKKIEHQFLRAQRMESIGTLAGGIAHDLNNSLAPVIMSLELLAAKFSDPDSVELLEVIRTSARRGADMVRQVLSFARGVDGERQEVQIRHLVRDVEKIVTDTFPKHIHTTTSIPNDLWTVIGDATQLHQVLLNLCVNARDAMPQGGTLAISAENLTLDTQYAGLDPAAHPGTYVRLQVEDSGVGILPEILERIFDPFFTTKPVGQGTGLGLSSALSIVKSHGGFLRAYSEPGKGTTFKVYLPAQTQASLTATPERAVELPRGNGELVLVVDDEPSVRIITQRTLEAFGYRVLLATDGVDAVAAYATRSAEIAVVLTDMMMPFMDGSATIQVFRKLNPRLPIIAASGLGTNEYVGKLGCLGVKHFLAKPYTAETLLKTLKQALAVGL